MTEKSTAGKKVREQQYIDIDFRSKKPIPDYVNELIETHLAIEREDAKSAGTLGYMARAMVQTAMPYKDPKTDVFARRNGNFQLRIVAGYEGGIPYGTYPRLLVSWIATEAVRTKSPVVLIGDSLSEFLRDVIGVKSRGGARGTIRLVTEQMRRLFGALVTAQTEGTDGRHGFRLRNVLIVDDADIDEDAFAKLMLGGDGDQSQKEGASPEKEVQLWTPQGTEEAGRWKSSIRLSNKFFEECITNPVPIDLRAYRALRDSPMAMDIYAWLTYRMSYLKGRSKPIRWEALMYQFGSGFGGGEFTDRAKLDFKRQFLANLRKVGVVYPEARVSYEDTGLILMPSPTHIAPIQGPQQATFW